MIALRYADCVCDLQGRSLFFEDGVRRIDYVLAWSKNDADGQKRASRANMREVFVRNLEEEGLETEFDVKVLNHYMYMLYTSVRNTFDRRSLVYIFMLHDFTFKGRARRCRLPQDPCSVGGVVSIRRDPEDPHANQGGNLHCTYRFTISIVTWLST